jgi:RNA polymerase primary sigma factor
MRATRRRSGGELEELGHYLDTFRRFPPLSRAEEHGLAVRTRAGDLSARQRFAQHNLAFVVAIARKRRRGVVRLDDMIQEGNLGLLHAIDKFDPDAGTRFATYACWWIRAYIGKYLMKARSAVRPRSGTIAQSDVSLDMPVGDESGATHLDRLEDDASGPEDTFLAKEDGVEVREALERLRPRVGALGWEIIHSRLQREQRRTLREIGEEWGLSRERVRQVEEQTKRILVGYLTRGEPDATCVREGEALRS